MIKIGNNLLTLHSERDIEAISDQRESIPVTAPWREGGKKKLTEKEIINEQLKELGIADNINGLTNSEAEELLVLANTRGNRGASQGRQRGRGRNAGILSEDGVRTQVTKENTQQENTDSDVFFMIDEEYKDVLRTATWRPLPAW